MKDRAEALLHNVLHSVVEYGADVLVAEGVVYGLAVTPGAHKTSLLEHTELVGYR